MHIDDASLRLRRRRIQWHYLVSGKLWFMLRRKEGYFTKKDKIRHCLPYFIVLLIGFFGLYLSLTLKCANYDGKSWALWRLGGKCWIDTVSNDDMKGFRLGFFAAALIGVGFGGLVVNLCRCMKEEIKVVDDDDDDDDDVENQHDEPSKELDPDADPIGTEETDAEYGYNGSDVEKQDEPLKASSNPVPVPVPIETRRQA